jgi:hypothetical protein
VPVDQSVRTKGVERHGHDALVLEKVDNLVAVVAQVHLIDGAETVNRRDDWAESACEKNETPTQLRWSWMVM